ncbi:MAG: hypothetical protein O2946_07355 [Planctomycetota bacterium]|nr:hypothetical protein [Planctomycetota bacterium]MDA0968842.1 hypothetical protein [Planctomycetota bacterium]
MRCVPRVSCCVLVSAVAVCAGCGEAPPAGSAEAPSQAVSTGDESDQEPMASEEQAAEPGEEGHVHGAGPHGGTIADWGAGEYHVEFTVDHDAMESVVYVLGSDAATPAPVTVLDGVLLLTIREPAFQVELAAWPLEGEAGGTASRYRGSHESLGIVREFTGTISGALGDTPYAGDFTEEAHEH